jgi:lysocardiolipin and lysophospholipid acyltransferase
MFYIAGLHGAVVIILKASLRNVPMAGLAMRLWSFIFLDKWETDRKPVGEAINALGRRATKHQRKLALLLYPEGTLVSALTRPGSAKYAEKMGIVSGSRRVPVDVSSSPSSPS